LKSKTQKSETKNEIEGAHGLKRKRFRNGLVVSRIGGYANSTYLQYFFM